MVFRQLQLGLALAILASSACGSDGPSTSAAIQMDVDTFSCSTDVEGLRLNCESTALVVVEDQTGDRIAEDCATLPVGALVNSAQVLQDTLALGTLPSDLPLTIRLSIYSGVLSPCPTAEVSASPLMFGSTQLVVLQEASGSIPLILRCGDNIGDPGFPDPNGADCSDCEIARENCVFTGGVISCDDAVFDCQSKCANTPDVEPCIESCQLISSFCSDGNEQFSCNQDEGQCLQSCELQFPSESCGERCNEASQLCESYSAIWQSCQSQFGACLANCGDQASCLTFGF